MLCLVAKTFPSDLCSFCTILSLCVCTHTILHCQRSGPSSPAAPHPTSSIAVQKEPGKSSALYAVKREAPEPVWQRLCCHRPAPLPEHPSPRLPGDGYGCFELLCQITLPGTNHSV